MPSKIQAPIAVFDSGSGGLSVIKEMVNLMPEESFVYFGDHAFVPYGRRSTGWIRRRVLKLLGWLSGRSPKLMVLACNTATVAGIDVYRAAFPDIPIIGTVPVIKTAVEKTVSGRITVLSTSYTAKSVYQKKLISAFAGRIKVDSVGSDLLVPLIESSNDRHEEILSELRRIIGYVKFSQIDVLALGCTHFPFIREGIREVVGNHVMLLDSGMAIARHAQRILSANRMLALDGNPVRCEYFTSGDQESVSQTASRLIGRIVRFSKVTV